MAAIASLPAPAPAFPYRDGARARRTGRSGPVLVSVPAPRRRPLAVPGHLLVTVALVIAGLFALVALAVSPGLGTGAAPAVTGSHVVEAGESMWSIALDHAPAGEAAAYVEHLVELNGSAAAVPGEVVLLPRP